MVCQVPVDAENRQNNAKIDSYKMLLREVWAPYHLPHLLGWKELHEVSSRCPPGPKMRSTSHGTAQDDPVKFTFLRCHRHEGLSLSETTFERDLWVKKRCINTRIYRLECIPTLNSRHLSLVLMLWLIAVSPLSLSCASFSCEDSLAPLGEVWLMILWLYQSNWQSNFISHISTFGFLCHICSENEKQLHFV